jgi:hypothetical protein
VWGQCTIDIPPIKEIWTKEVVMSDMVNHPVHYTSHPSGVETIQITEHLNFCLGNAIKYIMRSELKGKQLEDLKKAVWYIEREIKRLEGINNASS